MASLALEQPVWQRHLWRKLVARKVLAAVLRLEALAERARSRRALVALDDRMLSDLGLSRADVLIESGKPFWKD